MSSNLRRTLEEKGLTFVNEPYKNAGYVFCDGSFLSIHKNRYLLSNGFNQDAFHGDLLWFMLQNDIIKKRDATILQDNNLVRVNTGDYVRNNEKTYIDLPEKEISSRQYKFLKEWLYFVFLDLKKANVKISLYGTDKLNTYDFVSPQNENGYTPEQIIKEIKRLYNEAI